MQERCNESCDVSFVVDYPGRVKSVSGLLLEVRKKIKEIQSQYGEFDRFTINNISLYRIEAGVQVKLYFNFEDQTSF